MRLFNIVFLLPIIILSQEFNPGLLSSSNSPLCFNSAASLSFETLPSGGSNNEYSYQWQKSLDQSNWSNIQNANYTTYTTDFLESDTYYRVLVENNGITLITNTISVWILTPLDTGVLAKPETACEGDEVFLNFAIGASGAEWNWGGFLEFDYQWEQHNSHGKPFTSLDSKGWFEIGGDWNIYSTYLDEGYYYFRCLITSPYGCGSMYTNTIMLKVEDCSNGRVGFNNLNTTGEIIYQSNILGSLINQSNIKITIYDNGTVEKLLTLRR